MSENYVDVTFTRSRQDDLDVIRSTPWAKEPDGLSIQFLSEFQEFKGRMHVIKVGTGAEDYQIKVRIDLPTGEHRDHGEALIETVSSLQSVYDLELAGGHFDVEKVVINGQEYSAEDLTSLVGPGI